VDITLALMDRLGVSRAILVGNSAGGAVAIQVALRAPARVEALVLVDAAVYAGGGRFPEWLKPILHTPQARRLGILFVRQIQQWGMDFGKQAWHDPTRLTDEIWEGYQKPLQTENWDRALWEFTLASRPLGLAGQLDQLTMPALVITGDDDRIVPTEQSIRLAGDLPDAELVVIPQCGHAPQEECPPPFLQAVDDFITGLP
jgi:pimeloyl-ACP methyl ester carboxylesterase